MKRAFSDTVIQSSNIDENYRSEEEEHPLELTPEEAAQSLKNIPVWSNFKPVPTDNSKDNEGIFINICLFIVFILGHLVSSLIYHI